MSSNKYTLCGRLTGHQESVLSLAVSDAGDLLASGGFDGLRMWNLPRMTQLPKPTQTRNPGDPITCVVWLSRKGDLQQLVCCGTGLGYIIAWRQQGDTKTFDEVFARRIGTGQEIMSINRSYYDGGIRILTGTRDKRAQLWALDSKLTLTNIFSVELQKTVPRAVHFHGVDILVFGMYDGEIHTLRGKDGQLLSSQSTGHAMGGIDLNDKGYFVVDNAVNGFSLHRLEDGACIRSYETKPTTAYPKQVSFGEEGKMVVGGGENGVVHIFETSTGKLVQSLKHSKVGRAQTVTVHGDEHSSLIVTASSSNEEVHISLWKKRHSKALSAPDKGSRGWRLTLQMMAHLLTIVVAIIIIHEYYPGQLSDRNWKETRDRSSREREMENEVEWLVHQLLVEQRLRDEWSDHLAAQLVDAMVIAKAEEVNPDKVEDQSMGDVDTFSTLNVGQMAEVSLEALLVNI